jgi:hypothetical protein
VVLFSVTAGSAAVWVKVGTSLSFVIEVPNVTVADHVSVDDRLALMSVLALKDWELSATRTVRLPGVPL